MDNSVVIVFVEVIPTLCENFPCLSSAFIKLKLQELSLRRRRFTLDDEHRRGLGIEWDANEEDFEVSNGQKKADNVNRLKRGFLYNRETLDGKIGGNSESGTAVNQELNRPTILFPSEDPVENSISCLVVGYAFSPVDRSFDDSPGSCANIMDGTLVRILPGLGLNKHAVSDDYIGEAEVVSMSEQMEREVFRNHNPGTIRELKLRMALQLREPVFIGTTRDALVLRARQRRRRKTLRHFYNDDDVSPTSKGTNLHLSCDSFLPSGMRDRALLVHCPIHGSGKTSLCRLIAKNLLGCESVHVLQTGPLLAKYGSRADSALESMIHGITMSAAVKQKASICIILNDFDTCMPPTLSGKTSVGDAAAPVLNAMASHLKHLLLSLKHRHEFPFPSQNLLYNLGGKRGHALAVHLCLVAVVTCPDNGWRREHVNGHSVCILDALPMGTYLLPDLDVTTRLSAYELAFQQEGLILSTESRQRLHSLVVGAVWSRGNMFNAVARMLKDVLDKRHENMASSRALEFAFLLIGREKSGTCGITIQATDGESAVVALSDMEESAFDFVGGIADAKRSLVDALALDVPKRCMLASLGVGPPLGILLYGPPGTGKTLLAKAVARLLGASDTSTARNGGTFIALNSSEIVQSEIGSSEKIIVSAFLAARDASPAVIFIDEFQALFSDRRSNGSSKLSSTLLQCMDDVKQWREARRIQKFGPVDGEPRESPVSRMAEGVVVLGATNTPWMVDKAFLRPGRFDRIIHVGLPSESDRNSILDLYMMRMRTTASAEKMSRRTCGFTGAELSALCRAASVCCLLKGSEWVEERDFIEELNENAVGRSDPDLVVRNKNFAATL